MPDTRPLTVAQLRSLLADLPIDQQDLPITVAGCHSGCLHSCTGIERLWDEDLYSDTVLIRNEHS